MAFQQNFVQAFGGAWVPLCQYREDRESLLVSCPQCATTLVEGGASCPNGVVTTICGANTLRRSAIIMVGTATVDYVTVAPDAAILGAQSPYPLGGWSFGYEGKLLIDDKWGQWAQSAWFAFAVSAMNVPVRVYQEIYTGRAIVLSTSQGSPMILGPYGQSPAGYWCSDDLSAGPAMFRLSRQLDGDLVKQEWFAWMVGTANPLLTVCESWIDPKNPSGTIGPPDEIAAQLTVTMPKLSRGGCKALQDILQRIGNQGEPNEIASY